MSNDKEYELIQDDILVAGTSGNNAWNEIMHYAAVYGQDGPMELYEVTRKKVDMKADLAAPQQHAQAALSQETISKAIRAHMASLAERGYSTAVPEEMARDILASLQSAKENA